MDVLAQTFWHLCRNVLLSQNVQFSEISMCGAEMCYWAKMSNFLKYPWAEMFQCQNVPVLKSPCNEKFRCRIISLLKRTWRRTVHMPKCPWDEISVPKCLLLKCLLPKCQPKPSDVFAYITYTLNLFISFCMIFSYVILGWYHNNLGWKYCLLF